MDNFISGEPISNNPETPIPFDSVNQKEKGVSHAPLDLGGGSAGPAARPQKIDVPKAPEKKPMGKLTSTERVTGVKTFFTKLHAGALDFLDEQITDWLKANPDISVKRTNTATGEVVGKKTEPNIIVTIWF